MSKNRRRRKPFNAFLPASACHKELYDKLDKYATKKGISLADVVRQSVEFFLSSNFQKVEVEAQKVESN